MTPAVALRVCARFYRCTAIGRVMGLSGGDV